MHIPPPLCKHGRGPEVQATQWFNAHPMLSHHPTMVVTLWHHTGNTSVQQRSGAAPTNCPNMAKLQSQFEYRRQSR